MLKYQRGGHQEWLARGGAPPSGKPGCLGRPQELGLWGDVVRGHVDAPSALRRMIIEALEDLLRVSSCDPRRSGVRLRDVLVVRSPKSGPCSRPALPKLSHRPPSRTPRRFNSPCNLRRRGAQLADRHRSRRPWRVRASPSGLAKIRPQMGPVIWARSRGAAQRTEDRFRTAWPCSQTAAVGSDWQEMFAVRTSPAAPAAPGSTTGPQSCLADHSAGSVADPQPPRR